MYGYIYLIKDSLGFYKIGRTKNIESRIHKYKTENSLQINILHTYGVLNYIEEEKRLHNLFQEKKLNDKREWFKLEEKDIDYIKSMKTEKEKIPEGIREVSFGKLKISKIVDKGYIAYTVGYNDQDIKMIEAKGAIVLNNYIIGQSFDGIQIFHYRSLCILDKRFNIIEGIGASQKLKNEIKLFKDKLLIE